MRISFSLLSLSIAVIFALVKLTGLVTWSWWVVTSPLWLPFAFAAGVIALVVAAVLIVALLCFLVIVLTQAYRS